MPSRIHSGRSASEGPPGEFPDAWFVAEMIHGDYSAFVEASSADSVTQYEL